MIGHLSGRLLHTHPPHLVLEVGGVGYELEAPMTTFYDLPERGAAVSLFTHLLVREDAQRLFGFSDRPQREWFRLLLRTRGVGPQVALAILSTLSVAQLAASIHSEDVPALARVPGIGKKTAARLLLDLRDRADTLGVGDAAPGAAAAPPDDPVQDAIAALMTLGYKAAEANRVVRAVAAGREGDGREALIRAALQSLSTP